MSIKTNHAVHGGVAVSADPDVADSPEFGDPAFEVGSGLCGKRVGMVVFSSYPADPRPRRAVDALLKQGMSVDLICEGEKQSPKRETLDKLEIIRIPIQHYRGRALSYAYQYSAFILISAAILAWRSLRRRYHLVYVHNMPDILVLTALLPKLFGAKVILDQHDPMPELMRTIFNMDEKSFGVRVILSLEKWSIARADLVITVNAACKRIFSSRSCPPEKIGVVMNSPDEGIFAFQTQPLRAPLNHAPNRRFVVMYHGSLVERNGVDLAVDALSLVRGAIPTAELRIYGRKTPFLEQVMEYARSKGLESNVQYLGPRSLEHLAREIEDCDVGVIPNRRNAFTEINTPTRIFEYLAMGKPVIAPSTPGILDYFTEDSLLLFEPGNSADIARQIEFAAHNYHHAIRSVERGQQIYLQHTWKQERKTLVDLVGGLLSGREA
jgi:glycosyltransferase involved in cell wall biosynthesis